MVFTLYEILCFVTLLQIFRRGFVILVLKFYIYMLQIVNIVHPFDLCAPIEK